MACEAEQNGVRAIGIILQGHAETLHTAVDALYALTSGWVLNNIDALLPGPVDIKDALTAYRAVSVKQISLIEPLLALESCDLTGVFLTENGWPILDESGNAIEEE